MYNRCAAVLYFLPSFNLDNHIRWKNKVVSAVSSMPQISLGQLNSKAYFEVWINNVHETSIERYCVVDIFKLCPRDQQNFIPNIYIKRFMIPQC